MGALFLLLTVVVAESDGRTTGAALQPRKDDPGRFEIEARVVLPDPNRRN
jgi:hypothetical protein